MCDPDSIPVSEDTLQEIERLKEEAQSALYVDPVDYDGVPWNPEDLIEAPKFWVVFESGYDDDAEIHCVCMSEEHAAIIADSLGYQIKECVARTPDDLTFWYHIECGMAADILGGHTQISDRSFKVWKEDLKVPACKWMWSSRNRQPEGFPEGWVAANHINKPKQYLNGNLIVQGHDRNLVMETFNHMWLHINSNPEAFLYTIPWQEKRDHTPN